MPQTGPCRRPSPEGLQLHMHYMSAARIYKHTAAALVKLFGECDHYRSHQSCAGDDMETPGRADKPLWLHYGPLADCSHKPLKCPRSLPCMRSLCGVRLDLVASSGCGSAPCLSSRAELVLDYRFTRSLADRPSPRPIAPFIPALEPAVGLWLVISAG